MSKENKNGVSESLFEENLTDAEVCGYRFQPLRQRPVLADRPDGRDEWPWRARKEDTRDVNLQNDKRAAPLRSASALGSVQLNTTIRVDSGQI